MTTKSDAYEIRVISLFPGHIAVLLYDGFNHDPAAGWELDSASPLGSRVVEFVDRLHEHHVTKELLASCGINTDQSLPLSALDRLINTVILH